MKKKYRLILNEIINNPPQTQPTLQKKLGLSMRAIRFRLEKLEKMGHIEKEWNLHDLRSFNYFPKLEVKEESEFEVMMCVTT